MGGGGHHDLGPRPDPFKDPYGGLRVPKISLLHRRLATAFGALTTFWVLFRVKQDGSEIFLVRTLKDTSRPIIYLEACGKKTNNKNWDRVFFCVASLLRFVLIVF